MNLPVLGALFRSRDYQEGETELVIIVTPYLVKPTSPGQPADAGRRPADRQRRPDRPAGRDQQGLQAPPEATQKNLSGARRLCHRIDGAVAIRPLIIVLLAALAGACASTDKARKSTPPQRRCPRNSGPSRSRPARMTSCWRRTSRVFPTPSRRRWRIWWAAGATAAAGP